MRKPRTPGGTWSYRIDLGEDEHGKRVQKQVAGFRTKKEAQAALADAVAAFQRGSPAGRRHDPVPVDDILRTIDQLASTMP